VERLVLASSSPRRRELLVAAGFVFDVRTAPISERRRPDEPPEDYVVRLATEKAAAVAARLVNRPVLGADTVVVVDETVLGKPVGPADAIRMLQRLSGREHEVLTGIAVFWGKRRRTAVERTRVWFSALDDAEIRAYVDSGEPMDKAGAYAIQGRASRFIPRIDGSYTNVVGLPVAAVTAVLKELSAERAARRRAAL
jgi:septum formation protein